MGKVKLGFTGFVAFVCFAIVVQTAFAGNSIQEIKQRMRQRLPIIVKMKRQGIIGEDSRGYLEFVTNRKVNANIVAAENRDRKAVYAMIAAKQGVSIHKVEALRALQIAKRAAKGDFLKERNGTWYRK